MSLFKSLFSRSTPAVAVSNDALDVWCQQPHTRVVHKVDMCTALCAGEDVWGAPLVKNHYHTLLRVSLESAGGAPPDTLLVERVLSRGGLFHSVTPIADTLSAGGTLLHPDVHDRVCTISDGPSAALARDLVVERTLTFGHRASESRMTLAQLAQILAFVSRTTMMVCDGGDCRFQSRSFAFTCLAALAPSLPPRKVGEGAGGRAASGAETVSDSVYELSAEAFLVQVPWLVQDPASAQSLELIAGFKGEPRGRARARLYH